MHTNKTITCKNCGWSWSKEDSNASDMYLCHKCGFDNSTYYVAGGEIFKVNKGIEDYNYFGEYKDFYWELQGERTRSGNRFWWYIKIYKKTERYSDAKEYQPAESKEYALNAIKENIDLYSENPNDYKMEAGGLLAPNGNKSKLTPQQYKLVRTPSFKAWFGFWEENTLIDNFLCKRGFIMGNSMAFSICNSKIIDSIISFIPIDVMNNFGTKEYSIQMLLHDKSMFINILSLAQRNSFVIPFVNESIIFITLTRAKLSNAKSTSSDSEMISTLNTLQDNLIFIVNSLSFSSKFSAFYNTSPFAVVRAKFFISSSNPTFEAIIHSNLISDEDKKYYTTLQSNSLNISKVVDENGEPLVVYHGTPNAKERWDGIIEPDFYTFKKEKIGTVTDDGFHGKGFYFGVRESYANGYAYAYGQEGYIFKCFLNIREPLITFSNKTNINNYNDGVLIYSKHNGNNFLYELMVRESNQIKLADGSNTTFDAGNPDIRYEEGGLIRLQGRVSITKNGGAFITLHISNGEEVANAEILFDTVKNIFCFKARLLGIKKTDYLKSKEYESLIYDLKKHGLNASDKIHYIEQITVHEEFRGNGYASYLLNGIIDFYKDQNDKYLMLSVGADMSEKKALDNTALINFYERHGFVLVSKDDSNIMINNFSKLSIGGKITSAVRYSGGGTIFSSRLMIPSVRGGWTKEKILRYLKSNPSDTTSTYSLAKFISDLDSWQELKDRLYYHGTTNYIEKGLKPSIVFSDRFAESNGGGGYGDKYWGISLTKRKRTAESFSGMSSGVTIYPVFLKKDAKVIEREDLQDSSEIEDIIVELYEQGVDAVWIGGGEEELVVVNPECILLYKKGSQYFSVYGGFKSQQLTDEQIKEIYEQSKLDWENYYKKYSESNKEGRQEFLNSLEPIKFSAGGAVSATLEDVIALLNKYQFRDTKTPIKGGYLSFANRTKVNGNDVSCFIDTKEKAIVLDSQYGLKEMGYDLKLMEAYFKKNRLKKDTYKEGGKIEYGENEELHNKILAAAQIDKDAIAKATSLIFEDAGYHRGELKSKSDYFKRGYYGDNIGTGFYFISDPKEVVRGGSAKSNPKEFRVVDFSKYRLFRATDANTYWGTKNELKGAYRDLCRGESAKDVVDDILKNRNVEWRLKNVIREYRGGEEAQYLKSEINKLERYLDNVKNNREWEQCNKEIDEARKELSEVEKVGFDTVVAELFEAYEKEISAEDWFQSERFETLMLKALGYEGIDVRAIKNQYGLASPDSFSEGSVIFDLKDGTVKTLTQAYIEAKKKKNNPELVAIVDEALEKVSTQITYRNGGLTDAIKHCFQNLMTNGIVITNPNQSISVVMYNTGGQKRDRSLYDTALLSRYLGMDTAAILIDKFDKGWYDNFSEKEIDEISKFKRIVIINQNEVCFDTTDK